MQRFENDKVMSAVDKYFAEMFCSRIIIIGIVLKVWDVEK